MSFSSDVKKELCALEINDKELMKAELYGMLLFGRSFRPDSMVFTTESPFAAKRLTMLLETLYTPIIEKQTALRTKADENRLYKLLIVDRNDCERIYEDLGHSASSVTLRVNRANVFGEEHCAAFVRGVFLGCGYVSNPEKAYHAEFRVPHKNLSNDLCTILRELTEADFSPKTVTRSGSYIVYFKGSEQICDLLTLMGAPIKAMEIMGTKAYKQVRNNVNRRINGEVANIEKVISASVRQTKAIELIKKKKGLSSLPEDLREIALLRLENPEMSLNDLGRNLSKPISRSGANHRMQRILEYAAQLE